MEWIDSLVRENVPDQKAIYVGRCNPLFPSYLMNTGSIFHAGTLSNSDRYKWAIWKRWDQPPEPPRGAAAEPGPALEPPSQQGQGGLAAQLTAPRSHTNTAVSATQNQSIQSLAQPFFLQSNPRNRRNGAISQDGDFLLQVLI